MSYIAQLNHQLRPQPSTAYRVLDLFAGCGGLSLGFEAAGFYSVGYEMDERAAETYSKNLKGPAGTGYVPLVHGLPFKIKKRHAGYGLRPDTSIATSPAVRKVQPPAPR